MNLPPLKPSDHPESRIMQWSKLEMEAIQDYARQAQREAVAAYKAELFQKYEADTERATEAEGDAFTHGYLCGESEAVAEAVPEMKEALCVAICSLFSTDPQDVTNTFTDAELEQVLDITEKLKPESVEGVYRKAWDFLAAAQEVKP